MKLLRSALHDRHEARGARFAEFGGWEMPIQYEGVLTEHEACRTDAAVFDVSHLGAVVVEGPDAFSALQWTFTNDLRRIGPGRAQYTHSLDPADAHVVDDIIVWWVGDESFVVMPNASNTAPLLAAIRESTSARDITRSRVVLAVQGPKTRERLADIDSALAAVPRFAVARIGDRIVAGTGYTGEDGVEIHVPNEAAPALWDAVVAAGVTPAGLGARDTLRLEMGMPLHGHELGEGITPDQAGLSWVVRPDKGDFRGRDALMAERARGITRRLRGLRADGRQAPRAGCAVVAGGDVIGEVTSGNFSPTLGVGIGLAFVPPETEIGTPVEVDVRGRSIAAEVVDPPFVPRGKRY